MTELSSVRGRPATFEVESRDALCKRGPCLPSWSGYLWLGVGVEGGGSAPGGAAIRNTFNRNPFNHSLHRYTKMEAAGDFLLSPSTVKARQRYPPRVIPMPGGMNGRGMHSNVCFQYSICGQGRFKRSMAARAPLSRHQRATQLSHQSSISPPSQATSSAATLALRLPYNKQQPNSGQPPHRASAPPLRCRRTSPCRCCSAERLPLAVSLENVLDNVWSRK